MFRKSGAWRFREMEMEDGWKEYSLEIEDTRDVNVGNIEINDKGNGVLRLR
jgi:hypothetical protein